MELKNKIAVVTGAASGIGRALAHRFKAEGAKKVICSDINAADVEKVAADVDGVAFTTDVAKEEDIKELIEKTESDVGPIDLFCSNAGIGIPGGVETDNEGWQRIWDINVMSHVYAARHIIPRMVERGGGYLMNTSSAAGLLNQIGSASYGVTKHAAIGLGEWIAITHGHEGIKVSMLCPQAVRTPMTEGGTGAAGVDGMIEPEQLADAVIEGLANEQFLILPHPTVLEYMRRKTSDYDRWIRGMQRLQERFGDLDIMAKEG